MKKPKSHQQKKRIKSKQQQKATKQKQEHGNWVEDKVDWIPLHEFHTSNTDDTALMNTEYY